MAHRLDDAAAKLHRRKNGIIIHTIEEYLDKNAAKLLQEEAQKQSLRTNQLDAMDENSAWEDSHDEMGRHP